MITIGITSFNRGKYLDVLLESLRDEVICGMHQVVIVDNCSTEQLVHQVLHKHIYECKRVWINEAIVRGAYGESNWTNDEYIAKNIIIERAKHDIILFLQDDLQYIGPTGAIEQYAKALRQSPYMCLTANGVRCSTLKSKVVKDEASFAGHRFWRYTDDHFHTMGFFKTNVFDELGPYPTNWPQTQEYWGRSEDWYDQAVKKQIDYHNEHTPISATHHVPIFLPIWNDPRGGYAFMRGGKRYGYYQGAVNGERLVYNPLVNDTWDLLMQLSHPVSFGMVAFPAGWELPLDSSGDPLKYPQSKVMVEGPVSEIDE